MSLSVQGKTAIVTGAGCGVGLAVARHLVDRGARVMFADSDENTLMAELGEVPGGSPIRSFVADMGERLALANLVSATIDAFERVDILVNAHRLVRRGDPLDTDTDVLEDMMRQNMMASLRLSQLVARRMIKQSEAEETPPDAAGAIINISTLAGSRPVPDMLGYSIACAALDQATRGLALALAPHRIRVNGVRISSVMTQHLKSSIREEPELRQRVIDGTPLARIASPDEVVDTVLYLASAGAGFVTGQIIGVDGGRSLADPVTALAL